MTVPTSRPASQQPSLADLTARFVARRSPVADGCDVVVEPYEVATGFRIDPRTAWGEAVAVLKLLGSHLPTGTVPSVWPAIVRSLPPANALPLCLGHFPQQVSDLAGLLAEATPLPTVANACNVDRFTAEAERNPNDAATLLAAAFARLTGDYSLAARLLARVTGRESAIVRGNEEAALFWQKGCYAEAIAKWEQMPVSAVRAFNLGMAYLFTARSQAALGHLTKAVAELSDSTAWAHLAHLYLVLATR